MRTHRGAAKRFSVTGSGRLRRKKAYNSHLFTHKTSKRKRSLEKMEDVAASDAKIVRRLLGVGSKK